MKSSTTDPREERASRMRRCLGNQGLILPAPHLTWQVSKEPRCPPTPTSRIGGWSLGAWPCDACPGGHATAGLACPRGQEG